MNLAIAGGFTMDAAHFESQLERIIRRIKAAAKWLKDTLNQRGEP